MRMLFFSAMIFLAMSVGATAFDDAYPDPVLTPGGIDPDATKESLCDRDFKNINLADNGLKEVVFKRYGVEQRHYPCPCELDHFIPLELGGSDTVENLWPHPYHTEYGARRKDYVERRLHKEMCEDVITLDRAREIIRTDWVACFAKLGEGELCK